MLLPNCVLVFLTEFEQKHFKSAITRIVNAKTRFRQMISSSKPGISNYYNHNYKSQNKKKKTFSYFVSVLCSFVRWLDSAGHRNTVLQSFLFLQMSSFSKTTDFFFCKDSEAQSQQKSQDLKCLNHKNDFLLQIFCRFN